MPTLLLLRHAKATAIAPGRHDSDRPLHEHGFAQVIDVAGRLGNRRVDRVLCSPALRTRQTAEGLQLDAEIEFVPALYDAGSDAIAELIAETDERVQTLMVVGHAPGIPGLAHDLCGTDSAADAVHQLDGGFPPATLAVIEIDGSWQDPGDTRLTHLHLHR